ncbi:MAG TPA: beta-ketoacyl synthase N-terminal-like domain-containing protein, partial [Elusimicrobiales bacterium]|nr:beta-ketoacyl synthase N-terminal-like domain-containing protein [Elusimicrobiales bacterium]
MHTQKKGGFEPLAITGIGCIFPKAEHLRRFWANIKNGVDAITEIPPSHWSTQDYFDKDQKKSDMTYARRGGFLPQTGFDTSKFGIAPNAIEATDSAQLFALMAVDMALKDAGYGPD